MTANRVAELWKTVRPDADAADADLLARFAAGRDGDAFRELVRRHGPLVLGVCRRVAGHAQDAEDAFQAAFLILARKAGAVRRPELLGNWLYGVAYRVARRAKRSAARRRAREVQVPTLPDPPTPAADGWADLAPVLDEELAALPEWYRAAVLLCDVQGLGRAEAAGRLGVPEGTLSSRLSAGRKKLADRLAKRGITLSTAGLSAAVAANGTAAVPERLIQSVVESFGGGTVSAAVGELAREGAWPMRAKLAGVVTMGALAAVGWAALAAPGDPPEPADPPKAKSEDKPAEKPSGPEAGQRYKAKMTQTVDVSGKVQQVFWHPTRRTIAVVAVGQQLFNPATGQSSPGTESVHVLDLTGDRERFTYIQLAPFRRPLGWWDDGGVFVTETRESGLINALHRLEFWSVPAGEDRAGGQPNRNPWRGGDRPKVEQPDPDPVSLTKPVRTVPLEPDGGSVYAYRPASKTVLNDFRERAAGGGGVSRAGFREIDVGTRDVKRTVFTAEGGFAASAVSPNRNRILTWGHPNHTVRLWDAETGKELWSRTQPGRSVAAEDSSLRYPTNVIRFSPDGSQIALLAFGEGEFPADGIPKVRPNRVHLLDAATGKEVSVLAAATGADWLGGFSYNGRLFAAATWSSRTGPFVRVIEVASGRVLKEWRTGAVIEFSPSDRYMAVAELLSRRNDQDPQMSRLGLWEFARDFSELK